MNQFKWKLIRLFYRKTLDNRKKIRNIWRGKTETEWSLELISAIQRMVPERPVQVDDRTWSDLEMDRLFLRINRSVTLPGAQYLYRRLREGADGPEQIDRMNQLAELFKNDRRIREELQTILLPLRKDEADFSELLAGNWQKPPQFTRWLPLYPWIFATIVSASFFMPLLWFVTASMTAMSWYLHLSLFAPISRITPSCIQLLRMLRISVILSERREDPLHDFLSKCRKNRKVCRKTIRKVFWLMADTLTIDEVSSLLVRYVQTFFMSDIIAYYRLLDLAQRHAEVWRDIFEEIAALDASQSLAAFIVSCPKVSRVKWLDKPRIEAEELYHPQLEHAVPNNLVLENRSLLITGSNMSGKTTLLKTVGINLLLARAFGIACAMRFRTGRFSVFSSICTQESLDGSKSYYYREIERILFMIRQEEGNGDRLFLIDELFRGTNTAERLASSVAVLEELSGKGMVLVTTHDIELEGKLDGRYDMVHFREEVENGVHYFDYRMHPGPCRSRNAIRLLQMIGYPDPLVRRAMELL